MQLNKYSFGIGDRFAHQGVAQLQAFANAQKEGIDVVPVWNKSHREHTTIGSTPDTVREEAENSVKSLDWEGDYHVDADHIGLANVDFFMKSSDFFTLDVTAHIGKEPDPADHTEFLKQNQLFVGKVPVDGLEEPLSITSQDLEHASRKFLAGMKEASRIYSHIGNAKGIGNFITEVSIDETDSAQSPKELLLILSALAQFKVPLQTIAPKFTGRFNKGVDYQGDLGQFKTEFEADLAVLKFASEEFGLPDDLKLSVHSGSDKFSLYSIVREAIQTFNTGLHIKTAGTTWLEELIGLAEAGGEGLSISHEVYTKAYRRFEELAGPYADVIDIDTNHLPKPEEVALWSSDDFTLALRHDPTGTAFNPDFRQLLHIGYKVAAEMGNRYLQALQNHEKVIAKNVTENLYERHIQPLFHSA